MALAQQIVRRDKLNIRLNHGALFCPVCEARVFVPGLYREINKRYFKTKAEKVGLKPWEGVIIKLPGVCENCGSELVYRIECHNNNELGFVADVYSIHVKKRGKKNVLQQSDF